MLSKTIVRFALVIIATVLAQVCSAQAPSWQWAKSTGGSDQEMAYAVALDAAGNAYVTGVFQSSSITFGTITLTNANMGNYDIFIAKYNAAGTLLWAKSMGCTGNDWSVSAATDRFGNVYIAGYFSSPAIAFGSVTLVNANADYDIFLAKFDSNGNILWAKSIGGTGTEFAGSITTDSNGDAYVAGRFYSPSISFGPVTLTHTGVTSDLFLVKYTANGDQVWVRSASSSDEDIPTSVTTDAAGNVYITGGFSGDSITFGSITLLNVKPIWWYSDIFLAKYDKDGNVLWARSAGGKYIDMAEAVAVDASGNVYITGYFDSPSLAFGSGMLSNADSASITQDIFIAKYDVDGNELWQKSLGGPLNDDAKAIAVDASGSPYIAGSFESDALDVGTTTLLNQGHGDIFFVKYDTGGNSQWAKSSGGPNDDGISGLAVDISGNAYLAGGAGSPTPVTGPAGITNAGNSDIVVIKTGNSPAAIQTPSSASDCYIFPNPANDELNIAVPDWTSLEISTLDGKLIKMIANQNLKASIDIADLSKGVYFIKVQTRSGEIVIKKIVKI